MTFHVIGNQRVANVKDFNAVGNGSTDDSGAINSAIVAANSAKIDVYLPSGIYRISSSIVSPANTALQFQSGAQLLIDTESTTIAVGSNGISLPTSTIHVASTSGFPSSGTITVLTNSGPQSVTYTNTSGGNAFTGCSGGIGSMSTGNLVNILFTINGMIKADKYQVIFDGYGSGISLGSNGTQAGNMSVCWFGADPTGAIDSLGAFNNALIAMPNYLNSGPGTVWQSSTLNGPTWPNVIGGYQKTLGTTLLIPKGAYYLSNTWAINRQGVNIQGDAMSIYQSGGSILVTAPGVTAISVQKGDSEFHNLTLSHNGSNPNGNYNGINAQAPESPGPHAAVWLSGHNYNVGDIVSPNFHIPFGYAFQCIQSGTSAGPTYVHTAPPANWRGSEPAWIRTYEATSITAGSNNVNINTFGAGGTINVASTVGASLFPNSGALNVATSNGIQVVNYTGKTNTTFTGCTTSGSGVMSTFGIITNAWNLPVTDNTVIWQPIMAHGVDVVEGFNAFENIWIFGYPGNGYNLNSLTPFTGQFDIRVTGGAHYNCGGSGVSLRGGNTGECVFTDYQGFYSRGYHITDETIGEHSVFINCSMEDCESGLFSSVTGGAVIIGSFKEGSDSGIVCGTGAVAIACGNAQVASGTGASPGIGFSGSYAPKWTANTNYPAASRIVPNVQPDSTTGFIWYTQNGGVSGNTEPTWYPGYGNGTAPDRSTVTDGYVTWIVNNYSAPSSGNIIDQISSPVSMTKNWTNPGISLALLSNSPGNPEGGIDTTVMSFNVNDPNDTAPTLLNYDPSIKWYLWEHNSSGVQGMAHLEDNSIYTNGGLLNTGITSNAFPTGFYLGKASAGFFTEIIGVQDIGTTYSGVRFNSGVNAFTSGDNSPAGAADLYRSITSGDGYSTWKPNHSYAAGSFAIAQPNNTFLYRAIGTGTSGSVPVAWNSALTLGSTVVDNASITWENMGVPTNGLSVWLPISPTVGEDIYLLDLSLHASPYTLTAEECAHRVIRCFNTSGSYIIIVRTSEVISGSGDTAARCAAVNTWTKRFDNQSGHTITVKAATLDTGVAIPSGMNAPLWSDGYHLNVETVSGDLTGNLVTPLVSGIQGIPVSNTPPVNGQFLEYNGTSWVPGNSVTGGGNYSVINVITSGATGNGSTDDSAAIISASTAAASSKLNLYFPAGNYRCSNNVTIPAGVVMQFQSGAALSIDSGKIFTINGMINANVYQTIFDGYGTGISFGSNGSEVREISACWFGADPTGVNDSWQSFTDAIASLATIPFNTSNPNWSTSIVGASWPNPLPSTVFQLGYNKILIPSGTYWMTKTLFLNKVNLTIEGFLPASVVSVGTVIVTPAGITAVVQPPEAEGIKIRNIHFSSAGANKNGNATGSGSSNTNANGGNAIPGISGTHFPTWAPGVNYVAGQIVNPNYPLVMGYALQCVTGGVSAGPVSPGYLGVTITVNDATTGDVIKFTVEGSDSISHLVSYTIPAASTTITVATGIVALLQAISPNHLTNLSVGTGITNIVSASPTNVITIKRTDQLITYAGGWNTLYGTFGVTNGSATVSTTQSQVGIINVSDTIYFGSQVATVYTVLTVGASTITLTGNYTGTTNSATTAADPALNQLTINQTPSDTWRSFEPNLRSLIAANGVVYGIPVGVPQIRNWMPSGIYLTGDIIVTVPGDGYFYRAQTTGQTGTSPPIFPTTIGNTVVDNTVTWKCNASSLITDGYAVWQPVIAHGIDVMSGIANIENVTIWGYPGNAFNMNSNYDSTGCFGSRLSDCTHYNCGGSGIFCVGANTGENTFINVSGFYSKGFHIYDECGSPNNFMGCVMEDCQSGFAFTGSSTIIGGYKEGSDSGIVAQQGSTFIGQVGADIFNRPTATTSQFIGFSGTAQPTWTANTVIAPGSRITPVTQPDSSQGFIFYTVIGGTTGTVEPTWNPGYALPLTLDGSVQWSVDNYTTKSNGNIIGPGISTPMSFTKQWVTPHINVGIACSDLGTGANANDLVALAFNTSDTNDTAKWTLVYNTTFKEFQWQHNSVTPGESFLFDNNPYSYNGPVSSSHTGVAFGSGFFMGAPQAGLFSEIFTSPNPGSSLPGTGFKTGAYCITSGWTGSPGGASVFRNVQNGLAFSIWKPGYTYTTNVSKVLSPNNNGHLYLCLNGGSSGTLPIVWPTTGGTVTESTGVQWQDIGTDVTDGYALFLPISPIVSEDIYYLDLTGKSTSYTLTGYECAHRIIRVFNASASINILVETSDQLGGFGAVATLQASVNTWSKTFDNKSGHTVTVKATAGDTGVAIINGVNAVLWSDGYHVTTEVAAGDLSGSLISPLVAGLQGVPVSNTPPVNGQFLEYNGSSWVPGNSITGGGNYNVINVVTSGATGDGSTNDAAAIQNAINTAASSKLDCYFPAGTYRIGSSVVCPNGVALQFQTGAALSVDTESTTITISSSGVSLPTSTIHVVSTSSFPSSGTISVATTKGPQLVTYTNTSGGNAFTGCSGGIGSMAVGGVVNIMFTINGMIKADLYQNLFDGYGYGISFGTQGTQVRELSAIWFGADPSGVNDSQPAFTNAILAMPDYVPSSTGPNWATPSQGFTYPCPIGPGSTLGATLRIPQGVYWMAETLVINRMGIRITGANYSIYQAGTTQIVTKPGITAILLQSYGTHITDIVLSHGGSNPNGNFNGQDAFNLNLVGSFAAVWVSGKHYNLGDIVVSNQTIKWGYAFQCVQSGTSAGPAYSIPTPPSNWRSFEPAWVRTYEATSIAAGSNGVDVSTFAGSGVLHAINTITFPAAGSLDVATANGNQVVTYTGTTSTTFTGCTCAGSGVMSTNGVIRNQWDAPVTDNTVIWQPIEAHAINIFQSFNRLENVWMFGYPGNAIHMNSNAPFSGQFGNYVLGGGHYNGGGSGVLSVGGNTGENTFTNYQGFYSRGWHVRNESGSRDIYINCVMEDCEAGLFYTTGGATFLGGYKEGSDSGMVIGNGGMALGMPGRLVPAASVGASPDIGYSGYYAPTWATLTANGTSPVAAGARCVPSVQPDPTEGYIWYTPSGGVPGNTEPTWYPGYGNGTVPDRSSVTDGYVTWIVTNYTALSIGNIIGVASSPISIQKSFSTPYAINLALGNSGLAGSVGGADEVIMAFNTNDPNDTTGIYLRYDNANKYYVWEHNTSGTPGFAHLADNCVYSDSGALATFAHTSVAFPVGFFIGTNATGSFTSVYGGLRPGINFIGGYFTRGANWLTSGNNHQAGGAMNFKAITSGDGYSTWKPNYAYTSGIFALASPNNTFLYKCISGGTSSNTPVAWSTALSLASTVTDGSVTWENVGAPTNGISVWLPTSPAISEDIYLLDLSAHGASPYTLTEEECAHQIIRCFNASAAFTIIVKTSEVIAGGGDVAARCAAVNAWTKTFDNQSGQTITVKTVSGDTGVAIANGNSASLKSDGVNCTYSQSNQIQNIAILQTLNATDSVANIQGYLNPNDGGSGQFIFQTAPGSAIITAATSFNLTISTASSASPIVITTTLAHGLTTNQSVLISGVSGNPNANGLWYITSTGTFTFNLVNSIGGAGSGTGGTVASTLLTTSIANNLVYNTQVMISGITGTGTMSSLNSTWTTLGVISSTQFSVPVHVTGTYSSGGVTGDGGITIPTPLGQWTRLNDGYTINVNWFGAGCIRNCDLGSIINACDQYLGTDAGHIICECSGGNIANAVVLSSNHKLTLGAGLYTSTCGRTLNNYYAASFLMQDYSVIEGAGISTIIQESSGIYFNGFNAAVVIITSWLAGIGSVGGGEIGGFGNLVVKNLQLIGNPNALVENAASSSIQFGNIAHLWIDDITITNVSGFGIYWGGTGGVAPGWIATHTYGPGQCVVPNSPTGWWWFAKQGGITGSTEPSWLNTTVAAGSSGATLPQATINVVSTAGFASSGTFYINSSASTPQFITYTGTSGGNQFTGCSGGTGTLTTGKLVNGNLPGQVQTITDGTVIWEKGNLGTGPYSYDVHVTNCTFQGVLGQNCGCVNGLDFHIEGCTFLGNNFHFQPAAVTMIDCEISEVNNYMQTFTICNNLFDARLINGSVIGIAVQSGFSNVPYAVGGGGIISNNTMIGGSAVSIPNPPTQYGSNSSDGYENTFEVGMEIFGASGLLISNNTISFAYAVGIEIANSNSLNSGTGFLASNNCITGNHFYCCGDAVRLEGVQYNYVTNNFLHATSPGTGFNTTNNISEITLGLYTCQNNYIANNYLEYNGTHAPFIATDGYSFVSNNYLGGVVASNNAGVGISRRATAVNTLLTLNDYLVEVNGGSGITVTLPTAISPVGANQEYIIKNASTNTITIATTAGQTIDGSPPSTLTPTTHLKIYSDGANWQTL